MQLDLLTRQPSTPAIEPTPEKFRRAPGDPRDYRAEWEAAIKANHRIGALLEQWALEGAASGRVEVNALFARLRSTLHVTLDNSTRAPAADWLIERNPALAKAIRRRARKRTAAKVAP